MCVWFVLFGVGGVRRARRAALDDGARAGSGSWLARKSRGHFDRHASEYRAASRYAVARSRTRRTFKERHSMLLAMLDAKDELCNSLRCVNGPSAISAGCTPVNELNPGVRRWLPASIFARAQQTKQSPPHRQPLLRVLFAQKRAMPVQVVGSIAKGAIWRVCESGRALFWTAKARKICPGFCR